MHNLLSDIQEAFPDVRFNISSQELEYGPLDHPSRIDYPSYTYVFVGRSTGRLPSKRRAHEVLNSLAWEHRYDPVRGYLSHCHRHSQPYPYFRSVASELLGCRQQGSAEILTAGPDSGRFIPDVILERSLIGAVARTCNPGCRHDTVLILNNSRSRGQCQALEVLAQPSDVCSHERPWAVLNETPFRDLQKQPLITHKGWFTLIDGAEQRFEQASPETVREFFSRAIDHPEREYVTQADVPRHGITAGACYGRVPRNPRHGRPCFLPVNVAVDKAIDLDPLESDRNAIWAAAVQSYAEHRPYLFSDQELQAMKPYLAQFQTL